MTQDLSSGWEFSEVGGSAWRAAQVPGCVHEDLLRHGLIADPFYAREEQAVQWVSEREWHYRRELVASAELLSAGDLDLVFEGLDTVATVRLDGEEVLKAENMFLGYRLPVGGRLRAGQVHQLEVIFHRASDYIREARDFVSPWRKDDLTAGPVRIRKQQCQFGWDWGPRLVTAGIWRPCYLEARPSVRLASVHIRQEHLGETVVLHLTPEWEGLASPPPGLGTEPVAEAPAGQLRGELRLSGAVVAVVEDGRIVVSDPQLWWPAGHGPQPLYELHCHWETPTSVQPPPPNASPLEAYLTPPETARGHLPQRWTRRIGLRTIELDCNPDDSGWKRVDGTPMHRFGFRVNGRLIFAKGANAIPAHSFPHSLTRADYEPILQAAADANFNMVRVWGGGVYEHESFYDLCDELGLLVWQDLMFACELYPADEAFLASCRAEFTQQARRLRHRACLALWCGNNELLMLNYATLRDDATHRAGYLKLFLEIAPAVLTAVDGTTPYLHGSPGYDVMDGTNIVHRVPGHDAHDWEVWHSRQPVEHYLTTQHRFASEFGMQSYPSPEVARTFCPPEQLNVFSSVFENHQKNRAGNQIIFDYVSRRYRFPKDYRSLAYLSQLNQAYCMKVGIEHFRRQAPYNLGALYWQLNDCWPVSSWSSLEYLAGSAGATTSRYFPKWKLLHHFARRFFAPCALSLKHLGQLKPVGNNEWKNTLGEVAFSVAWDGPPATHPTCRDAAVGHPPGGAVVVDWHLWLLDQPAPVASGQLPAQLEPGRGQLIGTVDFIEQVEALGRERVVLQACLRAAEGGQLLGEETLHFTPPRWIDLPTAPIHLTVEPLEGATACGAKSWRLTLLSAAYHHAVWLEAEGAAPWWSDNAFDLLPGQPKVLTARLHGPATATEARSALTAFSLVDTY